MNEDSEGGPAAFGLGGPDRGDHDAQEDQQEADAGQAQPDPDVQFRRVKGDIQEAAEGAHGLGPRRSSMPEMAGLLKPTGAVPVRNGEPDRNAARIGTVRRRCATY